MHISACPGNRALNRSWFRRRVGGFALLLLAALLMALASVSHAQGNLVANGDFGNGMDGWQWEQWLNRPLPGVVDKADKPSGAASFKMGLAGSTGGRWLAIEIPIKAAGKDHVLSFALKLKDVPEGAARVRLGIPNKGFLHGDDLVRTGGSGGWKTYRVPVLGSELGDAAKVTLFFYHDQLGTGSIGIGAVSLAPGVLDPAEATDPATAHAYTGIVLTGDTSRPDASTFSPRDPVELTFRVDNLKESDRDVTLEISVVDEHDRKIEAKSLPVQADAAGRWQTKIQAPASKLGFYRVNAKLSNGVVLQSLGTRASGFLTYAVVPDPAQRKDYGEKDSRFGMQGGFGPWADDVLALLGARWVLDGGLEWAKQEPDRAGQFGADQVKRYVGSVSSETRGWHKYTLPTLMRAPQWAVVPATAAYMTGTLTPDGEKAWAAYCHAAARAYSAGNPDRKEHIYQVTWEPIQPWGFKGTNQDLVRIYEIAYKALHEADPLAVVAGPTRGLTNNGDPRDTSRLFDLGLGKYLDGYAAHPYFSITPEQDDMVPAIRTIKEIVHGSTKKNLPFMGTEQGWSTDEDVSKELAQAHGLIRQNLMILGEGFRFNFAFYIADYRLSGQKGYGYYYNLDKEVPFGPRKVSPRPIVPAYAAQSLLLDGCKSAGAIDWLGDKIRGYVFERADRRILAVWNYGKESRTVSIPTGVKQVQVYDWMGNRRLENTKRGALALALGPEPVYIVGVSPALWGSKAAKSLIVNRKELLTYPGGRVAIAGSALVPTGRPFKGELLLQAAGAYHLPSVLRRLSLGRSLPTRFMLDLDVPAALKPGVYASRLVLRNDAGDTIAATGLSLTVAAPLAMQVQPVFSPDDKPGVVVTLRDTQGKALSGRLDFRLKELLPGALRSDLPMIDLVENPATARDVPNSGRNLPFSVRARAAQSLTIPLPEAVLSPARHYQAVATVAIASGGRFAQTARIDFLPARQLRHPITVDGDLSDWNPAAVALNGPEDVVRSPQYYPKEGLSAQLRFAWDEQALYIAAEVNDNLFVQTFAGGDTWRGDSLQLAFSLTPSGGGAEERRASEITVAQTPNGPEAYRGFSSAPDKLALGPVTPRQLPLAIRRDAGGRLIYEMAIPWASLGSADGRAPKAGDAIGIAATVNEIRSADQTDPCALGLFGGIFPSKEPDKFGTLVLEGAR